MALITKSSVVAFKKETTVSELINPASGAEFVPMRSGGSITAAVETIGSDEMINSLGASKEFVVKEVPTASFPKYLKHSGVEGQEPEYGVLIESALGSKDIQGTERNTVGGSTAGTAAARATLVVDSGEGAEYLTGKAVMIKDATNGYSIRNVKSVATDTLSLNFNLSNAPASGINLGKAVQYYPAKSGHPSYSMHVYQASVASAYHQAIAGCRTTAMNLSFPANNYAEINFDIAGTDFYLNPMVVASTDSYLDFSDTAPTTYAIQLDLKSYKTPHELARAIEAKMNGVGSVDSYTVTFDNTTGKFTFTSDGTTFQLLWNSGANTANTVGDLLGFTVAADDTGALTYTSDNAISYDPAYTPSYDNSDNLVIKGSELVIGSFNEFSCRSATQASFSIGTPKVDINDLCDENGVSESVTLDRTATFSTTLILAKHEAGLFDKFINNTTTELMFNCGVKSGGNWVAGKCFNIYFPNASLTSHVIADNEGYQVINLEATAFVTSSSEEVFLNFL